jgi:choline monooxygenase
VSLRLDIDPDVRRARVPPAELYRPGPFQAELVERCFSGWQWLADATDLPEPRGAMPVTLLPDSLAEPLVVTRDGERIACLSNACTHRARLVCDAPTTSRELRCPYHGRRFGLDGRFKAAPGFEGALDFPSADDDLAALPLERFGPWLFTALAARTAFDAWFGPIATRVGHLPFDRAVRDTARSRRWRMDAHFALYVENYLEGLHIPFIHPGLVRALDFSAYRHELLPYGTLQVAQAAEGELAFEQPLPDAHPEHGKRIAAWYYWLFPNLMVNVYPWGVSMNRVRPLDNARCEVEFESYVWSPELLGRGAGGDLDQVEREDEAAVEAVQRGLAARSWRGGRYAPEHEVGTHHFHRLIQAALEHTR